MTNKFRKLMQKQLENSLNNINLKIPKTGWIKTIRKALGMPTAVLAKRMNCTRPNIIALEQREIKQTISLKLLQQVAEALDCKLVYSLIPNESFDTILKKQAQLVAQNRIKRIDHSMMLEQQGLTKEQLQQEEDSLVQELLQGDPKKLWEDI